MKVFLEPDPARKRELQQSLTAALPAWFGRPESNAHYADQAEILDGYVAESNGTRCGLLLVKWSGAVSAEIYWMGVDPTFHRAGVGRALTEAAIEAARRRGVTYLFALTLHPDIPNEPYQRTRRFYEAMGFVYVLDEHAATDPSGRTATYLKQI